MYERLVEAEINGPSVICLSVNEMQRRSTRSAIDMFLQAFTVDPTIDIQTESLSDSR
jgi:hypothetical protein